MTAKDILFNSNARARRQQAARNTPGVRHQSSLQPKPWLRVHRRPAANARRINRDVLGWRIEPEHATSQRELLGRTSV
jgi:hypothetical protein